MFCNASINANACAVAMTQPQTNRTKMKAKKLQTPHEKARHGGGKSAAKAKIAKKVNVLKRKGKLGLLLGHSVISVMRAMGKHGWKFDDAKAALDKAKIPAAEHTIRRALKRGQNGELRIAPVSAKDLAALKASPVKAKAMNAA